MRRFLAFVRDRYLDIVLVAVPIQLAFVYFEGWLDHRRWVAGVLAVGMLVALAVLFSLRSGGNGAGDRGWTLSRPSPWSGMDWWLTQPRRWEESVLPLVLEHLKEVQRVGLIATRKVEELPRYEEHLRAAGKLMKVETCDEKLVGDITAATGRLLDWMLAELPPSMSSVDLTHGTVLMSLGAFMAAEDRGVECEYTLSDYNEARQPRPGSQIPKIVVEHGSAKP